MKLQSVRRVVRGSLGKYYVASSALSAGRKYCQASGHAKKLQHCLQTSVSSFFLQAKK